MRSGELIFSKFLNLVSNYHFLATLESKFVFTEYNSKIVNQSYSISSVDAL